MKVCAIIVAAGKGLRMGSSVSKPFIELKGKSIIELTVSKFDDCDAIDEIILAVSKDELEKAKKSTKSKKIKEIIAGGIERQDSVWAALKKTGDDTDIVVIHDGVRPFVSKETLVLAISEAKVCGAVVVGVPVKDTIKKVNPDGMIVGTEEREKLWASQTPQVFKYDLIKSAYKRAFAMGIAATDDSKFVERLGHKVKMIMGSYENIKITTPEDLVIAEAILNKYDK